MKRVVELAVLLFALSVIPAYAISPIEFCEKYEKTHSWETRKRQCPPGFVYQVTYYYARKSYRIIRTRGIWVRRVTIIEQFHRKPAAAFVFQLAETPMFIGRRPLACIEYSDGVGTVVWKNDDLSKEDRPHIVDAILHREGVPDGS